MKGGVTLWAGITLLLLGLAIGRFGISNIVEIESPETMRLLVVGCVIAGVILGVIGILRRNLN